MVNASRSTKRGIFTVAFGHIPGTNGAEPWQSAEDRVTALLNEIAVFLQSVDRSSLQPGSAEMLIQLQAAATFLRGEIEVAQRRDPWRIADFALQLGCLLRDVEANEALHKSVLAGRGTQQGGKKGAIGRHGSDDERNNRHLQWKEKYDELLRNYPRLGRMTLSEKVGKIFGVGGRVVRNHVPNPNQKRKAKQK